MSADRTRVSRMVFWENGDQIFTSVQLVTGHVCASFADGLVVFQRTSDVDAVFHRWHMYESVHPSLEIRVCEDFHAMMMMMLMPLREVFLVFAPSVDMVHRSTREVLLN